MNRIRSFCLTGIAAAAACLLPSCARTGSEGKNDAAKAYFDAWVSMNYPDAVKTSLGAYIIEDHAGSGSLPGSAPYVRLNYTSSSLSGDLVSTTSVAMSKRTGNYVKTNYYGPAMAYRGDELDQMPAGIEESVSTMKVGGRRKVVIPGWLSESVRYDTEQQYLKNCSGTNYIYDLELVEAIDDIETWEKDSLARYVERNWPEAVEDSISGFYYVSLGGGDGKEMTADTTAYINYIGRRLDGTVFDTTIADTAKVWGIYSSAKTYAPVKINWYSDDGDYTGITMGDDENSTVQGFAYALSQMHRFEKGICFFWSGLGYAGVAQNSSLPAYSPLSFEIEMTSEP